MHYNFFFFLTRGPESFCLFVVVLKDVQSISLLFFLHWYCIAGSGIVTILKIKNRLKRSACLKGLKSFWHNTGRLPVTEEEIFNMRQRESDRSQNFF